MVKKNKTLNNYFNDIFLDSSMFAVNNLWLIIIGFLILSSLIYPIATSFKKTITIKKKYTRTRGRNGDSYFVVDNNNTIYQVNNLLYNLDFNRAEDWNLLEEGKTYKIKGYGFRMGFLDMYPTISSII